MVNSGGVKFCTYIGGAANCGTTVPQDDTQYIVIMAYDGETSGNIDVYVNGGSDESSATDTGEAADGAIIMGSNRTLTDSVEIDIMEICIYNTALSSGDVASLFSALNSKWSIY
jgi:hypothetical protein